MDTITQALEYLADAMEAYDDRHVELLESMEKRLDVLESKFRQEVQDLARLLTAPALPAPASSSRHRKKKRIPTHLREYKTGNQVYKWHMRSRCGKLWGELMDSGKSPEEAKEAVNAELPRFRSYARKKKKEWLAKNPGKH